MRNIEFTVPLYGFKVTFLEIESESDKDDIVNILSKFDGLQEYIKDTISYIENGYVDGGDTFSSQALKEIVVIVYPCKCEESRRRVINHEKRHVEDKILRYCNINDDEAAAYLAGYLSAFLY